MTCNIMTKRIYLSVYLHKCPLFLRHILIYSIYITRCSDIINHQTLKHSIYKYKIIRPLCITKNYTYLETHREPLQTNLILLSHEDPLHPRDSHRSRSSLMQHWCLTKTHTNLESHTDFLRSNAKLVPHKDRHKTNAILVPQREPDHTGDSQRFPPT